DLERHVGDAAHDAAGVIRVTCPEPIVYRMTALIERFHARHPKLRVEFVTSDRYLDLSKGEADVAFRSGDTDDELVGRKIADSVWAVYASHGYIERRRSQECKTQYRCCSRVLLWRTTVRSRQCRRSAADRKLLSGSRGDPISWQQHDCVRSERGERVCRPAHPVLPHRRARGRVIGTGISAGETEVRPHAEDGRPGQREDARSIHTSRRPVSATVCCGG